MVKNENIFCIYFYYDILLHKDICNAYYNILIQYEYDSYLLSDMKPNNVR